MIHQFLNQYICFKCIYDGCPIHSDFIRICNKFICQFFCQRCILSIDILTFSARNRRITIWVNFMQLIQQFMYADITEFYSKTVCYFFKIYKIVGSAIGFNRAESGCNQHSCILQRFSRS